MLWHIELKFCIWLCFTVLQIKFQCRQFASIFMGVMPLLELRILEIHSFPHFSLTCFDILSWKFCIWLCFTVLQIKFECRQFASIFVEVMPPLELRILEIHSFPHFSLTCFDILSWNFAYDFALLYYRSSSSVVNLCQFLWELCPSWNLEYWKYTVFCTFSYMLWNTCIEMKFCICLYFTVLQIKFQCCQFLWELCPFWNFQYWKYTVFRTFLLHAFTYWAGIFHMALFTVLHCIDQVWMLSLCVHQFSALSSYIHAFTN